MAKGVDILETAKRYYGIKNRIYEYLIHNGSPGDRLPPIKDFAQQLGLGQSNTERAVRDLVKEKILISKPRVGTFITDQLENKREEIRKHLHKKKPSAASAPSVGFKRIQVLRRRVSANIEAFLRRSADAFEATIQDIMAEVEVHQDVVALDGVHELKDYLDSQSDAIILINPHPNWRIEHSPSQVILMISTSESECLLITKDPTDVICADDRHGGFVAGRAFKDLGWKDDVCFIGAADQKRPGVYDKTTQNRLEGFLLGLEGTIAEDRLLFCDTYSSISGATMVNKWLKLDPRPGAIFAVSDDIAFGFVHGAASRDLMPGDDYQIIGFDGQQSEPDPVLDMLTTAAVPMDEMGRVAARILLRRLQRPDMPPTRIHLGCTLVKGSTARPRAQYKL